MTRDVPPAEQLSPEFMPVQPRIDQYEIRTFTEESDPELAQLAWAIHAKGYMNMHLLKPDAIDPISGQLGDGIDKSRGPLVDYRVAIRRNENADAALYALKAGNLELSDIGLLDAATMRKIHIPYGGTFEDLPAYKLCKESLYPWGEEYLRGIENPQDRIKEIAALTPTQARSSLGVYELIRDAIQDAHGKGEMWFCSLVSTTRDALARRWGSDVLLQIGEPVAIDDSRVSDEIKLVPVVLDVDAFFRNNYGSCEAATDPTQRKELERLERNFIFFSEGLGEEELGDQLMSARNAMVQKYERDI